MMWLLLVWLVAAAHLSVRAAAKVLGIPPARLHRARLSQKPFEYAAFAS